MRSSHPANPNPTQIVATSTTNPAVLPYNTIPNTIPNNSNSMPPTMPMSHLPQHQQYQQPPQGRIVSPVVSPILPRELIIVNPNHHPIQLPNQLGSGPVNVNININKNTMAWQHHHQQQLQQQQQQQQLNTARSYEFDEIEKTDTDSDVSSIPLGSIRPDPNYDPAKDPISPENVDKPFVAPLEITIRVVKERRRKTLGSFQSNTIKTLGSYQSNTSHTTQSTAVTPPRSSAVDQDQQLNANQAEWLQSPENITTQTGSSSIPKLGLINSLASDDASDSNSFSGSTDQFQSAEERMHLEEDLLEMQETQAGDQDAPTKQRKGMVRREFNRRIMRFKKHKKKNKNGNNNNNISTDFSGDDNDNDDDASGNKIIIQLKINDISGDIEQPKAEQHFKVKSKHLYPSSFGGRLKHHESKSMRMIVGQENGC